MVKKQQYKEKLTRFFEKYSTNRRAWQGRLNAWKQRGVNATLGAQLEGLMAQIEDYHNALSEMLAQQSPDYTRIARMHKQMKML